MSRSSLWVMDQDFKGHEINEYGNSWLFSPIVWDVLLDKYMHEEIQTPYGYKKSLIGLFNEGLNEQLNDKMNNSDSFMDRICWEISNQQVFFTKNKEQISKAITNFVANNNTYHKDSEENVPALTRSHIASRFREIAADIQNIDEEKYPYFVFKNTSVDDNVELWFEKYNEDKDEYEESSLKDLDSYVTEFVVIKNNHIEGFISNLDYFK